MEIVEIQEAIEVLAEEAYEQGWDDGYTSGLEELDEKYQEGHDDGWSSGVLAERDRIRSVLKMMMDFAMQNNKMAEAKGWKMAIDIIEPVIVDQSEEAYQRQMEAEGF